MRFYLEDSSGTPIYVQLMHQILRAVATGVLGPGDQVPTVRQIAVDLKVNPNTVNRAFAELERDGVITTQRGRGTFVSDKPRPKPAESRRRIAGIARRAADEALASGYGIDELVDALAGMSKRK